MAEPIIAQLDELSPVECPCGEARRAFCDSGAPASIHLVEIRSDSKAHYHKRMTEFYVVVEGTGEIELDGKRFPIRPMTTILIPPGVRHRALGKVRVLNVPVPAFDPRDEWFD